MRRLTATEAARHFSELLDQVERTGETFVVERRGRAVASISPAAVATGRAVKGPAPRAPLRQLVGGRAGRAPRRTRATGAVLDRLILDTTILIAAERGGTSLDEQIGDDDDVTIAAITAAELLVGELLATGKKRRAHRRTVVTADLAGFDGLPSVSLRHAAISE